MIQLVNARFIPVWVNVRADAYPLVPALSDRDWTMWVAPGGVVLNPFYLSFLVRSYVLSPDCRTLLNDQGDMLSTMMESTTLGSNDYVPMLEDALRKPRNGCPRVVITHTIKGKGISYMETEPGWHLGYLAPEDEARAAEELRAGGGGGVA